MGDVLKADLDAIRGLADTQRTNATDIRAIDVAWALAPAVWNLPGSDVAAQCSSVAAKIEAALDEAAGR